MPAKTTTEKRGETHQERRMFWPRQSIYLIAKAEGIDLRGLTVSSLEVEAPGATRDDVVGVLRKLVAESPVVGMEVTEQ
jgi:hypothetical protein